MDYTENYRQHLRNLIAAHGEEKAMSLVVGGDYDAYGIIEASVLKALGVDETSTILDVGCGTGRMGYALRETHRGHYIGTDILREMLDYADRKVGRKDWKYLVCAKPPLPLSDSSIDVACLFSVFTHLMDEEVFRYLKELKRLLKPNGIVVFSYLDFGVPSHWTVFEHMLADTQRTVLNRFTSKDSLRVLASAAGLQVQEFWDGHEPKIELREPARYNDGRVQTGLVGFGQSLCICHRAL
jgi:SAM-dependent methyltransferase